MGNAEAARLYQDADAYVTKVTEGTYSYLYMQFFWKRAESFVERAQRVYPDSPTGRALRSGQLKVGPYSLDYFKGRVLPKLEEKRTYTVDAVSCAIFLYNRDPQRWDDGRRAALEGILEVLARQQRWGEALAFPVGAHRDVLLHSIFQVAARYDEQKEITLLLNQTKKTEQAAAGFAPVQGEAMALLGKPRSEIVRFLRAHPEDEVKLAVLHGMIEREVRIRRSAALKVAIQNTIATTHYDLRNLKVRDDVEAVSRQFFPDGDARAHDLILSYRAALGTPPTADAPLEVHLAYLEYLAAFEHFDEVENYATVLDERLSPAVNLKAIELLAAGDRVPEAERRRGLYANGDQARSDAAVFAQFSGQIESNVHVLTVHEKTFAELPIKDPCILAQAITEEALEPNQSIRGATPWDAVVLKFDPGFDHLAAPKSMAVGAAASATNPY